LRHQFSHVNAFHYRFAGLRIGLVAVYPQAASFLISPPTGHPRSHEAVGGRGPLPLLGRGDGYGSACHRTLELMPGSSQELTSLDRQATPSRGLGDGVGPRVTPAAVASTRVRVVFPGAWTDQDRVHQSTLYSSCVEYCRVPCLRPHQHHQCWEAVRPGTPRKVCGSTLPPVL